MLLVAAVLGLYVGFRDISVHEIRERNIATLELTRDVFESVYAWLVPSFVRLIEDPVVSSAMYGRSLNIVDYADLAQRIQGITAMSPLIHSVYLYNTAQPVTYSTIHGIEHRRRTDPSLEDVIRQAADAPSLSFIPRRLAIHPGYGPDALIERPQLTHVLTFVVFDSMFHESPLEGCLVVNVSEQALRRMFVEGNSVVNPTLVIVDAGGVVLSDYREDRFAESVLDDPVFRSVIDDESLSTNRRVDQDGNAILVSAVKHRPGSWAFIATTSERELTAALASFRNIVLLILVGALGISLVASYTIASNVTRPVRRLARAAHRFADETKPGHGEPTEAAGGGSESEIDYLDRVLADLGSRAKNLETYVQSNRAAHQSEAIRSLLTIHNENAIPTDDLPAALLESSRVRVDVVRIDGYQRLISAVDAATIRSVLEGLSGLVRQSFPGDLSWCVPVGDDHVAVVHASCEEPGEDLRVEIEEKYQHLISRFSQRFGYSVTVGMATSVVERRDTPRAYEAALAASDQRFRIGAGKVIWSDTVTETEQVYRFNESQGRRLADELALGHVEEAEDVLHDILRQAGGGRYEDFRFAAQMLFHILARRFSPDHATDVRNIEAALRQADTIEEVHTLFASAMRRIARTHDTSREMRAQRYVEQARHAVDRSLSDPALSPDSIADELGISAGYLRELFRQYAGESLSDFIVRRRIERAKTALIESNRPVKEIVQEVGFQSYNYFFTVFKRATGTTPGEFRRSSRPSVE